MPQNRRRPVRPPHGLHPSKHALARPCEPHAGRVERALRPGAVSRDAEVGGARLPAMSAAASGGLGPIGDPAAFALLRDKLIAGPWGRAARRALAVVSVDPGDGRSYVCSNLAVSLGLLGRRTLLIDADTVRPSLHRLFGVDNSRGLSDVLGGAPRATCIQLLPAAPMVSLLAAGPLPAAPLKPAQGDALAELVQGATEAFDHVILDTPAAGRQPQASQALHIAMAAGFALVVGRDGPSPLGPLRGLVDLLVNAGVQVTGIVINDH